MYWPVYVAARCHAGRSGGGYSIERGRFGSNVCRMHGGGGGATEGNRNAIMALSENSAHECRSAA